MEVESGAEAIGTVPPRSEASPAKESIKSLKRDQTFTGFSFTNDEDDTIDKDFLSCVELLSSVTTSDRTLEYDGMAAALLDRYTITPQKLIKAFCVCVLETPHCASFYANVACHLNNKDHSVVAEIIEALSQILNENLEAGNTVNPKFILVNSGVVEASEFLDLCQLLVSVTAEPQKNLYRCDFFTYLVLTALPWSAQKLHLNCPELLSQLLQNIGTYFEQRKQLPEYETALSSITLRSPFTNEEIYIDNPIEMLWAKTKDSHTSEKFELVFLDMYTDPEPAPDCVKHKLSLIVIPTRRIICRNLYKPTFYIITPESAKDDQLLSLPDPKCMNRFIIDDVITDLIRLYSHNHTECVRILTTERLFYDNKDSPQNLTFEYRASIVECIIKEVLALPMQENSPMYYNSLIISLVMRRNENITKIMGRVIRILFTMLDSPSDDSRGINFESLKNLTYWFAVHLNNFKFIWNWEYWKDYFDSPKNSAKYMFIKETLEICTRLCHPSNAIETVTKSLKGFGDILPENTHTFNFKYDPKAISNPKLRAMIETVQGLIADKKSSQTISEALHGIDGMSLEDDNTESSQTASSKHVLFDCVLTYGSKSLSYLLLVLERYQELLKAFNGTQDEMFETLYIVASYCKNNTQYLELVVDRLTNYRIVSDEAAVSWLLSEQIAGSFCHRIFFSVILHNILYKPKLRLLQNDSILKKKLEAKQNGMDVDGAANSAEIDSQKEEAEALKVHENNKKNILSRERSLFLLTFRKLSDAISDKFLQLRNEGVESPEKTPWCRWMIDHLTHVGTYFREEVKVCSDDIERALSTADTTEPIVAARWLTLKSYYQLP